MQITITIPDDIAAKLGPPDELERRVLESFALSEYQAGRLTRPDLQEVLGFRTRVRLDGFLKDHGVIEGPTFEEVQRQVEDMKRLGL